ncbi:hypothetical protein D3C84_842070 [compost metagenome]
MKLPPIAEPPFTFRRQRFAHTEMIDNLLHIPFVHRTVCTRRHLIAFDVTKKVNQIFGQQSLFVPIRMRFIGRNNGDRQSAFKCFPQPCFQVAGHMEHVPVRACQAVEQPTLMFKFHDDVPRG